MLPDVALLRIFDFHVDESAKAWHRLVHVCRSWRNVVFGSPKRLRLRLHCRDGTPVRKTLDVWPLLPIVVAINSYKMWRMDDVVAALEHNDRVCILDLWRTSSSQFEHLLAAMQQPFPQLRSLTLGLIDETVSVVPASFLGGFALGLQYSHSIPGIAKANFVYHTPCSPYSLEDSPFRVFLTRDND